VRQEARTYIRKFLAASTTPAVSLGCAVLNQYSVVRDHEVLRNLIELATTTAAQFAIATTTAKELGVVSSTDEHPSLIAVFLAPLAGYVFVQKMLRFLWKRRCVWATTNSCTKRVWHIC
jgi:hypothetical protein